MGNLKKEHSTGKHTKHHTLGGRAYPVRHYPIAVRLRDREGHAILCIALNPQSGDFSGAILGVRSVALLHGEIRQGIRELKEKAILRKVLFGWLGVLWSFIGLSLVLRWSFARSIYTRYKGIET